MWKTTLYVLLLSAVGAALCLTLLTQLDPGDASSGGAAAAGEGATVTGALEPGPMAALRDSERAVVEAQARALARHPDVLRLVDPARAARQQGPVLRPNQPPTRASSTVVPSADELIAPARAALDNDASLLGGSLALVEAATGEVLVATGDEASAVVETLRGREGLASKVVSGVMSHGDGLVDVLTVPVNGGSHWLAAVRTLDGPRLAAYDEALGEAGEVTLVRKGEIEASTAEGPVRASLDSALSQLRSASALAEMPSALASGTDVGQGRRLRHGVVIEDSLDESPSTTAIVFSAPATALAAGGAPSQAADAGDGDLVSVVRSALTEPKMPLLIGALSAVVLLALLAWLLVRADRNSWLRRTNRQLTVADDLDDVHLAPAARRLVDTVRDRTPARTVAAPAVAPAAASAELNAELDEARARANEATLELETAESRARQLQTQVEYARKEVGRVQTRTKELEAERDVQRERIESLESDLASLRDELDEVRAHTHATAVAPAVTEDPATVVSPVVDVGRTELDSTVEGVLDSTDALFAGAFQALEGTKPTDASSEAATLAFEGGNTLETPRVDTAETRGARLNRKAGRDYDTAEVDGDEMSQLLDEIDTKTTGEFGQIDIPGEAYRSEEFPDLPGSLENLADELGSMSDSQIRRLDEIDVPESVEGEGVPPEPASPSGEFVSPDAGNRTAQLWGVNRPRGTGADRSTLPGQGVGRQTLPGGLRVATRNEDEGDEQPSHATAPPPWKKGSAPPRSLSPASLLEALKKRGQSAPEAPEGADAESSESTRVARFSRGLLDKTPVRQPKPKSVSQSGLFSRTGSRVDIDPTNDSEYFKSLYDDFVETKRRCGENIEKITLDRFVTRLARNKKQLMDRYGCRTVRFQVYVKGGKAALKATPVK